MEVNTLTFYEEIALLALEERKERVRFKADPNIAKAWAVAMLAELAYQRKIGLIGEKKLRPLDGALKGAEAVAAETAASETIAAKSDSHVEATTAPSSEEPATPDISEKVLRQIQDEDKDYSIKWWIDKLSSRFKKRTAFEPLFRVGLIAKSKNRYLGLGADKSTSLLTSTKYALRERLRLAVFGNGPYSSRDVVLLGIVRECGILKILFTKDERRIANYIIKLVFGDREFRRSALDSAIAIESASLAASIVEAMKL